MKIAGLFLVWVLIVIPQPLRAQDDGCAPGDLEFLAADFLDHFSNARSESERLNLMFEYLSFVAVCKQDFECSDLNTTYAERLSEAQTLDDLLLTNLDLSANLAYCYSERPDASGSLADVFSELGLDCEVPIGDMDYIYAECSGPHDADTAQAMYDAALAHLGVENIFFDVILDDSEYTFTGDEWLVTPR